jgi:hypothetical protein
MPLRLRNLLRPKMLLKLMLPRLRRLLLKLRRSRESNFTSSGLFVLMDPIGDLRRHRLRLLHSLRHPRKKQ